MSEENLTPAGGDVNPMLQTPVDNSAPETPVDTPVTPTTPVAPDWRTDWREAIAGGDAKELERLKRFTAVPEVYKSLRSLETKMSSGKFKQELGANPTADELTAYRKANNIPDTPQGYFEKLPQGLDFGEADRAGLEVLANKLHAKNASPEIFNTVMEAALELISTNQEESINAQVAYKEESRHKLYQEWGPAEYKVNINAIANVMQGMPPELRERFEGATLADGSLMFNDAEALKWWAQYIRENNPALAVMPAGNGDAIQNIEDKLNANRQMMRNPSEWQSKANAARRAEHTKLLETFEAMKRKGR